MNIDYVAPTALDEAVGILAGHAGASVVAGGQSLIPAMTVRRVAPSMLVDIGRIASLHGILSTDGDAAIRIGATTTLAELAADDLLRSRYSAIADAAASSGDALVRNRATLGGSLADGHPAGDLIAAAIALGAVISIIGPNGRRDVAAGDFVVGPYATALTAGEIITHVDVTDPGPGRGSAYIKQGHPGSGYAICGVAAALTATQGEAGAVRLVVTGATDHPRRLEGAEDAASGNKPTQAAVAAEAAVAGSRLHCISDLAGSAAYRKHLAGVLASRAIVRAAERAGGA